MNRTLGATAQRQEEEEAKKGVGSRIRDHVALLNCRLCKNKPRAASRRRLPSSTLIHDHASCLPGRRPSSAVHHFGEECLSVKRKEKRGLRFEEALFSPSDVATQQEHMKVNI
jgi:hypothetical protein